MKPGPKGRPEQVLRDAAILYGIAVELEGKASICEWDKLRHAAIRYAEAEKRKGRPRKEER